MIWFQKPGDPVALAVALANTWDTLEADPELLRDAGVLERLLAAHGIESRPAERDVARARALRDQLRAVFDVADEETAVELLNEMLLDAKAVPQLERAEPTWRVTYAAPHGDLVDAVTARAAMPLLEAIRDDGWERFGRCAAAPCCCVFVDRSKNRSRRYCSDLCADRVAQAAYRERRRRGPRRARLDVG
jgi:predicted RNA-binding Zn ribbon-like protein